MCSRADLPTRSLKLTGASNFRDLGGYAGQGGRLVRWRRLFRSDHLAALTPDDVALLSGLGLALVCDFRGDTERAPLICALPGVVVHSLPIERATLRNEEDVDQGLTRQKTALLQALKDGPVLIQ